LFYTLGKQPSGWIRKDILQPGYLPAAIHSDRSKTKEHKPMIFFEWPISEQMEVRSSIQIRL
jgi:hypothetical protein